MRDIKPIVLWYSYFVWICGFYYEAFHIQSYLASCSRIVSVLRNIVIPSGNRNVIYMLFVHVFVNLVCVTFCMFSFPLGMMDWLRLVVVA